MKFKRIVCSLLVFIFGFFTFCLNLKVSQALEDSVTFNFYDESTLGSASSNAKLDAQKPSPEAWFNGKGTRPIVSKIEGITNVYINRNGGLCPGTGKAVGTFTLQLSQEVSHVEIKGSAYDAGTNFKLNGIIAQKGNLTGKGQKIDTITDPLVWDIEPTTTLKFETNPKRASIFELTLSGEPVTIHTVNFHNDVETTPVTVKDGDVVTKPEDPQKTGYVFVGWYTEPKFINLYNFETPVTSNLELYAKFVEESAVEKHTVSFDTVGGSPVEQVEVVSGNLLQKPENPTKKGFAFDGWYLDKDYIKVYDFSTPVTADFVLYAKWLEEFSVQFNTMGGSAIAPQTVKYGNKAVRPSDPSKTGFVFENWYTSEEFTSLFDFENTPITANTVIYAHFIEKDAPVFEGNTYHRLTGIDNVTNGLYLVSYEGDQSFFMTNTIKGKYLEKSETIKNNFIFEQLENSNFIIKDSKGQIVTINGEKNISLESEISTDAEIKITFDNGVFKLQFVNYGAGTYYLQYNTGSPRFTAYEDTQQNLTLYKADVQLYTVSFVDEDNSILSKANVIENNKVARPTTDPIKPGYKFVGWYTDTTFTTEFDFENTVITEDINIVAKFREITPFELFEQEQTRAGLRFNYKLENGKYVVSNIGLKFGVKMSEKAYVEGANYGVLLVEKNNIGQNNFGTLVKNVKDGKDIKGIVEALSQYGAKNFNLNPVKVNEEGNADEAGHYYQFAGVITNMDLRKDLYFSAIIYMEYEGQVYLMQERTSSVNDIAGQYIANPDLLGISDPEYLTTILDCLKAIKGVN